MTVELDKIMGGLDDVRALGVVKIVFREAKGLRAADIGGKSDPYATLSLGTSHKFIARTRVIPHDLHPVWNETHYCLITEDDVKNGFPLTVRVFDYDMLGGDDTLGQFLMRVDEVVSNEGILFDGWKALLGKKEKENKGDEEAIGKTGKLNFQIGFFPKTSRDTRKADANNFTGGVLKIHVHQCQDLLLRSEDQAGMFVSPYVHVFMNGTRSFRTRVKPNNPSPVFNAQTEVFCRDWKTARIRIVVKDKRGHEHDPVIGVVVLTLADVFKDKSDTAYTAWLDLGNGIGFGKIRVSLVFNPVKMNEAPNLKGYAVGELELNSFDIKNLNLITKEQSSPPTTHLVIRSPITDPKKSKTPAVRHATFDPSWPDQNFKLHVPYRYQTSLRFEVRSGGAFGGRTLAVGKMFLQDLVDGEQKQVVLELRRFRGKDQKKPDEDGEMSLGSTEKTKPGDIDPTVPAPPPAAGTIAGAPPSDVSNTVVNENDGDDETGWASDSDVDTQSEFSEAESETASVASNAETEAVPSSVASQHGSPELAFTAIFRPGLSWIAEAREGDETEIELLGSREAAGAQKSRSGEEKEQQKMDKLRKSTKKVLALGGGGSTTVSNEGVATQDRHKLGGNKVSRTLVWGKDKLVEGAKKSRVWNRGMKKSLPQFATS